MTPETLYYVTAALTFFCSLFATGSFCFYKLYCKERDDRNQIATQLLATNDTLRCTATALGDAKGELKDLETQLECNDTDWRALERKLREDLRLSVEWAVNAKERLKLYESVSVKVSSSPGLKKVPLDVRKDGLTVSVEVPRFEVVMERNTQEAKDAVLSKLRYLLVERIWQSTAAQFDRETR